MNMKLKVLASIVLLVSPTFSFVVFRADPSIIMSGPEGIESIEEIATNDNTLSNENHRQKIPKRNEIQKQDPLTTSEFASFLGLNENLFGGPKSVLKELQTLLTGKDAQKSVVATTSNPENIRSGNELLSSDESTSMSSPTLDNQEPLKFGDVLTLLALWHLANAFNDYATEEDKISGMQIGNPNQEVTQKIARAKPAPK